LVVVLGVAAFVVGIAPITYEHDPTPPICTEGDPADPVDAGTCVDVNGTDTIYEECGSLFMPKTPVVDECAGALTPLRMAVALLTAGAIVLAVLGAKTSGSMGRQHTRAWEAFLVGGVFAAFLAGWTLVAWAITNLAAWESSQALP
jgi:hypothetical protein